MVGRVRTEIQGQENEGGEVEIEDGSSEASSELLEAGSREAQYIVGLEPLGPAIAPEPDPPPLVPVVDAAVDPPGVAPLVQPVVVAQQGIPLLQQVGSVAAVTLKVKLQHEARTVIEDCQEFVDINEHLVVSSKSLDYMDRESCRLVKKIDAIRTKIVEQVGLDEVDEGLRRWKTVLKRFMTAAVSKFREPLPPAPIIPQPVVQQPPPVRRHRDPSPDCLGMVQRDLEYFMDRLRPNLMPDASYGSLLSNTEVRELHDVTMPLISKAVDECRKVLNSYTRIRNHDQDLAYEALTRCQDAADWIRDITERHRERKLHLDRNTKHREITFKVFKAGGDVSVYEFLSRFEEWADDYLSEEAKADQLYHKYLDKSITDSYTELSPLRYDFNAMKEWLVRKFGSVVPMAHGVLKNIAKITVPKETQLQETAQYLRTVHKLLGNLAELEISKGRPVPKLQSYLASNAFLTALINALPNYLTDKFYDDLAEEGVEDSESLEGREYFPKLLSLIKTKYRQAEFRAGKSGTGQSSQPVQSTQSQAKKQSGKATAQTTVNMSGVQQQLVPVVPVSPPPVTQLPPSSPAWSQPIVTAPPPVMPTWQPAAQAPSMPSFLTGGNAVPIQNPRPINPQQSPRPWKKVWDRWACPIREHDDHSIIQCAEFWGMSPGERRDACRGSGCYTCMDRNRNCRGGCTAIASVPVDAVCKDCSKFARNGISPANLLFCGILHHAKPSPAEIARVFEAWIPNLNIQGLGATIRVNLTCLGVHSTAVEQPFAPSKTGPPTPIPSNVVFDTVTGDARPLTRKDVVKRPSEETAFYTMQTVRIKNEEVIVFYDSGSNGHLIEGELAERLQLDVVASESVPIGALGGKALWSEYGEYSVTLGPDIHGECHELEMQGIPAITKSFPEVNLKELWPEVNLQLKGSHVLPERIGGSRAKILVGIKATQLGPKLLVSLPSGLGVYESRILDIYGSNVCFGGPHEVFSQAYRKAGLRGAHVQVMFTEMASAYINSPRTFMRVDVDDHGPPLRLTQELDLVAEFESAFSEAKVVSTKLLDITPSADAPEVCSSPTMSLLEESEASTEDDSSGTSLILDSMEVDCPISQNEGEERLGAIIHCEHVQCLKSHIPLSKLKGLQDEQDIPEIREFRCEACSNCPTCKLSARAKTKSLQESFEQTVIEKSVHLNLEEARVWVDLPFIKDPVEFLTKKHGGSDNYRQALRVYHAQCKKREDVKDQVRTAHSELVEKGYMVPLDSLSEEQQQSIMSARFRHYYPWRAVYKEDSVTTPVRLVVDPTMTGLNEILAKGENMLSKIPELLIKFRAHQHVWNTDISKLYNQLHLNESALPYSLFLFHRDLDASKPPDIWVMTRAWYGVSSTGNQAGVALEQLAENFKETLPHAYAPLVDNRYVDDILSGGDESEVQLQIRETQLCLKAGGFSLKYVARDGEPPPPKASSNGRSVTCLGIVWDTVRDTLGLAFDESFFLKRTKGQKVAWDADLSDPSALREAFSKNAISRAGILSRVAELYDPCGWWEPVKLQMKLAMQSLNGLEWSDPVPSECWEEWVKLFSLMSQLKAVTIPRTFLPKGADSATKIRLLAVSDAAASACGVAVYAGVELDDGSYTCDLVLAKSKMVHSTIPRNELEGVVLGAEALLAVQRALDGRVESTRLHTDSRIVVCWVLNTTKKLRMWAFNRVQAIRNMIKVTQGDEVLTPLYHIAGTDNLADLLTKERNLTLEEIQREAVWYTGLDWMKQATESLPSDQFESPLEDGTEEYEREIFQEVAAVHMLQSAQDRDALVNLFADPLITDVECFHNTPVCNRGTWFMMTFRFVELGWQRAWRKLHLVLKACALLKHGVHKAKQASFLNCEICRNQTFTGRRATDLTIDRAASSELEEVVSSHKLSQKFVQINEVWYSKARLFKEGAIEVQDLDCLPFFDQQHLKKFTPVVPVHSELFQAYLAYIHLQEMPHMGVENTLRRIQERFYPVGRARAAILRYRKSCTKCRLMLKEVVELELADFPTARTTVAPPFWSVQLDIAMSFLAKPRNNARKTFPCHALVIVCLLTSATAIHVLEGLTTQTVIQALERHAARFGVPAHMYVDSGTQLEKLQDASFRLRSVYLELGSQRFTITVVTPKAHQQQGRVEAKVKVIKKMIQAWSTVTDECNTLIGWETLFARVANAINDVPIARGSASAPTDLGWEIITPNRLILGRNSHRQLDGPIKITNCPQTQLERNRLISARWYEIFIKRLNLLIPPPASGSSRQPECGDVVLFVFSDPNFKKLWVWKLGVIEEKLSRSSYRIRYSAPDGTSKFLTRAVGQISIILPVNELEVSDARVHA